MDKRTTVLNTITGQGVLPLYFHADAEVSVEVLKALYDAGIRAVEYTNRGEVALDNFKQLRKVCDASLKDLFLGVGTIKDAEKAGRFTDAGADFLISPGLAEDVFDTAYSNKILWIPGCMTPTEMIKAEQFGITLVKLFPGNTLGPAYVSAVKEVFPGLSFMPTGGVEPEKENLRAWFNAGVFAVGMGGKLIAKSFLENKDYPAITALARKVMVMIEDVRRSKL